MPIVALLLMALIVSVLCGGFLGGMFGMVFGFNPDVTAASGIIIAFALITLPLTLQLLQS